MILSYGSNKPQIGQNVWVAPDATVSGNVIIGEGSRIMHGARIIAEAGGTIQIGRNCIVLENAVIRATNRHPCLIGNYCLVGPNSHIVGAQIADEVFLATGVSVFHGATLGKGSEVRINGVVHLRTHLEEGTTVPIGWVAVGNPAKILPPEKHDEIWAIQMSLDFPGFVYGLSRAQPALMQSLTEQMSQALGVHSGENPVP